MGLLGRDGCSGPVPWLWEPCPGRLLFTLFPGRELFVPGRSPWLWLPLFGRVAGLVVGRLLLPLEGRVASPLFDPDGRKLPYCGADGARPAALLLCLPPFSVRLPAPRWLPDLFALLLPARDGADCEDEWPLPRPLRCWASRPRGDMASAAQMAAMEMWRNSGVIVVKL